MQNENVTIIMIEDDAGHALLIEKNLRRNGIANHIVHLDNGRAAMDYFAPDNSAHYNDKKMLVLLDLNLPQVDGFEVLKFLKENERTRKIPVVVLTTTSNPTEIDRCYSLGCNLCIIKPLDFAEFSTDLEKIGMLLSVVKMPYMAEELS